MASFHHTHQLDVEEERVGPWQVLVAAGELDLASAPGFAVTVRELVRAGARTVCLDLSAIEFVDSAGLAVLVNARRALARVEGRLVIVAPPGGRVARLLHLCGLWTAVEVAPDRSAAISGV